MKEIINYAPNTTWRRVKRAVLDSVVARLDLQSPLGEAEEISSDSHFLKPNHEDQYDPDL